MNIWSAVINLWHIFHFRTVDGKATTRTSHTNDKIQNKLDKHFGFHSVDVGPFGIRIFIKVSSKMCCHPLRIVVITKFSFLPNRILSKLTFLLLAYSLSHDIWKSNRKKTVDPLSKVNTFFVFFSFAIRSTSRYKLHMYWQRRGASRFSIN